MLNYQVINPELDKTIVFITGAGVGKWMWQHQEMLQYKLILFDLPGHGDNKHRDFTTIADVAKNIIEILDKESIEKASLVGHSIGAQVSLYMLQHEPNYVDKAMVISGLNKAMTWALPLIKMSVKMSMPLVKKEWFAKLQSKELALPNYMFQAYFETSLTLSLETLVNILRENMSFVFEKTDVAGHHVTFVVGQKEKKIMLTSARMNQELVKGSHYVCIRNAAHGIPYETPELINDMIKQMLED